MAEYKMTTPLSNDDITKLKAGDIVYLNGIIYTARDAAHKKLVDLIEAGEELPFNLEGSVIYFVGPTPPKLVSRLEVLDLQQVIEWTGYSSKFLIKYGQKGMIGQG